MSKEELYARIIWALMKNKGNAEKALSNERTIDLLTCHEFKGIVITKEDSLIHLTAL